MSKAALTLLAKVVLEDIDGDTWQGGSKTGFRQKNIDYKKHWVKNFTVQDIENQLRLQVKGFDRGIVNKKSGKTTKEVTTVYDTLEQAGAFSVAAAAYHKALAESFTKEQIAEAAPYEDIYAIVNNYDDLSKRRFKPAQDAAVAIFKQYTNDERLLSKRFLSPDHTNANADIRFSRALYSAVDKGDPSLTNAEAVRNAGLAVLDDLFTKEYDNKKLISERTYKYFINVFADITSRYTNGLANKEFDLKIGAEIQPRSQYDNEEHGRMVAGYVAELAAAAKIIGSKQNWAGTKSSDDYATALTKELNNILVKHGAKGKLQKIDSKSSQARETKKITITRKAKTVTVGSKTGPAKGSVKKVRPAAAESQLSLEKITQYINARLPEAVRSNMGANGALVNRTGRFSQSARLVGANYTEQGYPTLGYTYSRTPYDVFDPRLGKAPWNTPGRNPRALVEKSIRDIAREMTIGRFYLRRV